MNLLYILRDIALGALCGLAVAGIFYLGLLDDDADIKAGKKIIISGGYPN